MRAASPCHPHRRDLAPHSRPPAGPAFARRRSCPPYTCPPGEVERYQVQWNSAWSSTSPFWSKLGGSLGPRWADITSTPVSPASAREAGERTWPPIEAAPDEPGFPERRPLLPGIGAQRRLRPLGFMPPVHGTGRFGSHNTKRDGSPGESSKLCSRWPLAQACSAA